MDRADHRQGTGGAAVKWAHATSDVVDFIGHHLREADCREVWLSDRLGPLEAVRQSWLDSLETECHAVVDDDGVPVALCGVSKGGVIWMLCTDGLLATAANRRQFIREGKCWVNRCLQRYGPLSNWVYAKNMGSIRWLKSLGFTVRQPAPFGPSCALFCMFEGMP
jgi:hypothetical protein